jgi:hypothetical protein
MVRARRVVAAFFGPPSLRDHVRVADERAIDVNDLATARTLIATLHDELRNCGREKATLPHPLDVFWQRLLGMIRRGELRSIAAFV